MDALRDLYTGLSAKYDALWELRDPRMEGLPLMGSPWPTVGLCLSYVFIVKIWGPHYMRDRKPMDIRSFLIVYNAFQVALSTFIFVNLIRAGWFTTYSFRCQPVDYSNDPAALRMVMCCYVYYLSKFTEFVDTFCFVARKKFNHVSLLHVVHHGIMPLSVWPGARWVPGGHASFFGLLNTFVHIFMYFYYMLAAMGPQYQKYIWWKQHMTSLQMVQFVGIMVHGFQLLFTESCGFPWQYGLYIAAHAVMFFILFSQFYIKEYFVKSRRSRAKVEGAAADHSTSSVSNGHSAGKSSNGVQNGCSQTTTMKRSVAVRKDT